MKTNYKNWMPKGMIWGTAAGSAVCMVLFLVFGMSGLLATGLLKTILETVFLVLCRHDVHPVCVIAVKVYEDVGGVGFEDMSLFLVGRENKAAFQTNQVGSRFVGAFEGFVSHGEKRLVQLIARIGADTELFERFYCNMFTDPFLKIC